MRSSLAIVALLATLSLTTRVALAEDKAPLLRARTPFIGAFFDIFWSEDTRTRADGAKAGTTEVNLGGDATIGYMLTDRWAILLNGGYTNNKKTLYLQDATGRNASPVSKESLGFVAPAVRYYLPASDSTYFFLQAKLAFALGSLEEQSFTFKSGITSITYKEKALAARLNPGVTGFLSDHLAAEASIGVVGVSFLKATDSSGNARDVKNAQVLIYASSINLGLVYYF